MTLKKVIWHLGFQKTGTTFIQRLLDDNEQQVSSRVFLANKGERTKLIRRRGVGFCELKNRNALRRLRSELQVLRAAFDDSGHLTMLFSDEVVMGYNVLSERNDFVQSAVRLLPVLAQEFDGYQSTFVFYTRAFDPWTLSVYNQGVKALAYHRRFEDWRALYRGPTDWSQILRFMEKNTGCSIQMIPMERDGEPFLGAELLRRAGFSEGEIRAFSVPVRQNESMPDGALHLLRIFNSSGLDAGTLSLVRRKIRKHPQFFVDRISDDK